MSQAGDFAILDAMGTIRSIAFAALAACGGGKAAAPPPPTKPASPGPSAPEVQRYGKMTPEERCAATAPRTRECTTDLMVQLVHSIPDAPTGMDSALRESPEVDADAARRIHETFCVAERELNAFSNAVVACWSSASCGELADCVGKHGGL
jgi:hypothetical protein